MSSWGHSVRALAVGAALLAACSDDEPSASTTTSESTTTTVEPTTTTAPERPASTTTTEFDPSTVEGEVEAAYLKSWDVYAEAVYNLELDEEALAEVYAGGSLETVRNEIRKAIREKDASYVRVDHNYQIIVGGPTTVNVLDTFVNHQVTIDPVTKEPTEPDPSETQIINFKMDLIGGKWKVVLIERVET